MHMLAVLTAPRPGGISYVARTLSSLDAAGAASWAGPRVVYVDGIDPLQEPLPAGWEELREKPQPFRDERKSMWAVFAEALARGADRLTFVEDDVRAIPGALAMVDAMQVPDDLALIKWFDGHVVAPAEGIIEVVCHEKIVDNTGFRGACAMTLPRRTLQEFVDHPATKTWRWRHFGDGLIGTILDGRRYGVYVPNPFQHVGGMSSTGNKGLFPGRRSATFQSPQATTWEAVLGANGDAPVRAPSAVLGPEHVWRETVDAVRARRPFCHLRLGEGESAIILLQGPDGADQERREYLTGQALFTGLAVDDGASVGMLKAALARASSLGLPSPGAPNELVGRALSACGIDIGTVKVTDAYAVYKAFVETTLLADLKGASALLVGSAAKDVADFSSLPDWKAAHNGWDLACEALPCPKRVGRNVPRFRDDVVAAWKDRRHDLVLVGAGAPGKIACAALADAGAVALDVGRLFEALRGISA